MKKNILLMSVLIVLTLLVGSKVEAKKIEPDVKEIDYVGICDKKDNCEYITDLNYRKDFSAANFNFKDGEIYLNNSEIVMYIYNNGIDVTLNVSGTNKIHLLSNLINTEEEEYKSFTVKGTGTLEIEKIKKIKKNVDGEIYYEKWEVYSNELGKGGSCIEGFPHAIIAEVNPKSHSPYTAIIPEEGHTKSEFINLFVNRERYFYPDTAGKTFDDLYDYEQLEDLFWDRDRDLINDLDERRAFIEELLDEEHPDCGYTRIKFYEPIIEEYQLTRDWAEKYIITDLNRTFTENGSYLLSQKPEEPETSLEKVKLTQAGDIIFESTEEFDSNNHLSVNDITDELTDEEANKIQIKTDKTLLKLYDINMLDKDNNVIEMKNGTYTIKIAQSDLLKKYNDYEIVYIDDDKVELIPAKIEEGFIIFNTTHLSKYGVVGKEQTTKKMIDLSNSKVDKNPKTADNTLTYGLVFFTLLVASITTIIRIRSIERTDS